MYKGIQMQHVLATSILQQKNDYLGDTDSRLVMLRYIWDYELMPIYMLATNYAILLIVLCFELLAKV